ncbi:toxin-antitoxin system YwqK family antitoxin [Polaribacter aquimarinus]|uniref:Toxin-antitoxin system YwqK family antitoxin n=1 Tax=Polaribacter aquimarinus TaxID=2100726 RepID=A0A2U2J706_9FLAO|nr:hypothetical protein [Polaribacter aquimarinus]PWG04123.1 hypothetical protein DIS07_14245 [Polaribacter aquimarinus]
MKIKLVFFLCIVGLSLKMNAQEKIWLDGNLKETNQSRSVFYKIEKLAGKKSIIYFKNGNIFRKYFSVNKRKKGKFEEYYSTGELKTVGTFENDLEEGIWKTYYKSGKIKERGKYKNGEKVGVWKTFYKNL